MNVQSNIQHDTKIKKKKNCAGNWRPLLGKYWFKIDISVFYFIKKNVAMNVSHTFHCEVLHDDKFEISLESKSTNSISIGKDEL